MSNLPDNLLVLAIVRVRHVLWIPFIFKFRNKSITIVYSLTIFLNSFLSLCSWALDFKILVLVAWTWKIKKIRPCENTRSSDHEIGGLLKFHRFKICVAFIRISSKFFFEKISKDPPYRYQKTECFHMETPCPCPFHSKFQLQNALNQKSYVQYFFLHLFNIFFGESTVIDCLRFLIPLLTWRL